MDLLPKTHQEFSSAEYWNSFFKKRGKESFEWYGEYAELSGVLHKYIKTKDRTLVIGCGSSRLSEDLYDLGYHSLVNIDISDVVIKQMKARNDVKRPELVYEKMDVYKMLYDDGHYSVVLDKGTLDALLPDGEEKSIQEISGMFEEINRVLRVGGRYLCISLAQRHIVDTVLKYFFERGWMCRVHCLLRASSGQDNFPLPVFAFVFTKFKQMPGMSPILEFSLGEDGKAERYSTLEDLSKMIEQSQNYSLIRDNLQKKFHPDDQVQLDLHSPGSSSLRYRLTVVDRKKTKDRNRKFAIFIIPHGREIEWMFSTNRGRLGLAESAGFQRLVVVSLHRGQSYGSLATIQDELSAKVMDLAPHDLDPAVKVPFLSAGADIGSRTVLYEGESAIYGNFVVEDVTPGDGPTSRRLLCLSKENFVQSEVELKRAVSKGGKNKVKPKTEERDLVRDYSTLSLDHQTGVVAGLAMIDEVSSKVVSGLRVLVIGLSGCTLPIFLHKHYKKVHIDIVENDVAMVTVAKEWFGLETDDLLSVSNDDCYQYVDSAQKSDGLKYDALILNLAGSCDTKLSACLHGEFLSKLKEVMSSSGVLIVSHMYQEEVTISKVNKNLKDCFGLVSTASSEETPGTIVYCTCMAPSGKEDRSSLISKWRTSANDLEKLSEKSRENNNLDLSEYLDNLKIL